MASRIAMNSLRNLPVKTVLVDEGVITRVSSSVSPMGGINEGAAYYATPVVKGDIVQLSGSQNKDMAVVKKYASGLMHGIAVSHPQGIDNTTASGATPVDSLKRRVDVAFFGLALLEIDVTATQDAGEFFVGAGSASVTGSTTKGDQLVVRYAVNGEKAVVLIGFGAAFVATGNA